MSKATPMLRQYLDIKKRYPGTILFFRLGDFYEMFQDDAITGARELDITLTARHKKSDDPIPMCGVPHHAAANYIAKLVRKGYRVAICEQTEEASPGKKLVKRDVVRIVTPGTAIDEQLLDKKEPVYLASVCGSGEDFAVAFLELSTGELSVTSLEGQDAFRKALAEIESFSPKEVIFPDSIRPLMQESGIGADSQSRREPLLNGDANTSRTFSSALTQLDESTYGYDTCLNDLKKQFGVRELTAFGIEGNANAVSAAGACLGYAFETQRSTADHITSVNFYKSEDHMVLDPVTLRNLEIVSPSRPDAFSKRTLLGVIDQTVTGMGGRLLRNWILRPSLKISEIESRQGAVVEFEDTMLRESVRILLKEVADLERLVGKLNLRTATPRDILALGDSLAKVPEIKSSLEDASSILIRVLAEHAHELPEIRTLIEESIDGDAPVNIADGGVIRAGFSSELDDIRGLASNAKKTIAGFESEERERTGIGSLHVKFNNVFGYFIEVSKTNLSKVPGEYERRQTLTNAERFTTPELKEWEGKVLGAEERIRDLEAELFRTVRSRIASETKKLQSTARALAALDALSALAETAAHRDYVKPTFHKGDDLTLQGARHPVVEAFSNEAFIPNDIHLNNSTDRLLIITGANMGGKSTVLRQTALIQILAQIGSFVPASYAKLPIVDRIWTRVGASDDLASGRSTFMVEMTETASILHNATPNSLILLDEIGRGTSTFDGLSIAWAVAEYLHDSAGHSAKTLFATHYHELTELAANLPGARNYSMSAIEKDGDIIFLHKLEKGSASKSYGIAVAKLAGLPVQVIERAKVVLGKLEEYELAVLSDREFAKEAKGLEAAAATAGDSMRAAQFSLFAVTNESAIDELRELDLESISDSDLRIAVEKVKSKLV
ncbi:MAG: DNA mismatch repair protein MutS [Acidobacteria bacterium]|nr:MAG: DNA mismatch repair protein MutS [Acidobacteriota bacterium]REK01460.1 MAG: DNA mismatch repair protein MutS [Acidobacteriota bacterium]REK14416.1 MAG: DNA mismatch repair protein MutS [Acidobacteriota bacterium]REK45131.1 MAG: DNA mismatch repair protein MutS [Acidobacteriota bacterium]